MHFFEESFFNPSQKNGLHFFLSRNASLNCIAHDLVSKTQETPVLLENEETVIKRST